MSIPLFTPPTAAAVFSNTVAGSAGNKAVETAANSLFEPLNRRSIRTDLGREIETRQNEEYRERERVKIAAKQLAQHEALAKSPPTSRQQLSWRSSHNDRIQMLTEAQIRAEERERKAARFSNQVSDLQQLCEKEQQLCAQRREAAQKALKHENSSTSGWTGWW